MRVAAVVPAHDGRGWLPACLGALRAQERPFDLVVVVDDGSADDTVAWLMREAPDVRVVALLANRGFAHAANRGIAAAAGCDAVALVNTDVELAPDWLAGALAALVGDPSCASVATRMVRLDDPSVIDDAGDVLRRDGVCEQRGRGHRDAERFDVAEPMWGASAGAALYRRAAVLEVGGFEERFVAYLEDVDLALRLRLAAWTCRYVPVVARHAGGGSADGLPRPVGALVARNTLLLVARAFPFSWWGMVAYRMASWTRGALRAGEAAVFLRGVASALPLLPAFVGERRALRREAVVPVDLAVPARPWRGPHAGGHPDAPW